MSFCGGFCFMYFPKGSIKFGISVFSAVVIVLQNCKCVGKSSKWPLSTMPEVPMKSCMTWVSYLFIHVRFAVLINFLTITLCGWTIDIACPSTMGRGMLCLFAVYFSLIFQVFDVARIFSSFYEWQVTFDFPIDIRGWIQCNYQNSHWRFFERLFLLWVSIIRYSLCRIRHNNSKRGPVLSQNAIGSVLLVGSTQSPDLMKDNFYSKESPRETFLGNSRGLHIQYGYS